MHLEGKSLAPLELDDDVLRGLVDAFKESLFRYRHARDFTPVMPVPPAYPEVHAERFGGPHDARAVLEEIETALLGGQIHVASRRYFGLFNMAPSPVVSIMEGLLAATNSQLATRGSAAYPIAVEDALLRYFGKRVGFTQASGTFTGGGAEANHTAMLCALTRAFPAFCKQGVRALSGNPIVFVTSESHDSILKAARACGLGDDNVRQIPVDGNLQVSVERMRGAVTIEQKNGNLPFLIVGTVGTTNAGLIDPIAEFGEIAKDKGLWFHVDAAWGALLAMRSVPQFPTSDAIDSITWDAHKTLAMPVGTGMLLTRDADILHRAFQLGPHAGGGYMPSNLEDDPFARGLTWSRRSLGLKLWMMLRVFGIQGAIDATEQIFAMGTLLKSQLTAHGFALPYPTRLPLAAIEVEGGRAELDRLRRKALTDANAWVSVARLSTGKRILRACINHARTDASDVEALVTALSSPANCNQAIAQMPPDVT